MKSKKISIILPTHRRADVIACAIHSVLYQTYSNFELLIVGDGCDAATKQAVLAFEDPRLRFFEFAKAPGFGYANRNTALKEACGVYIAYMSDDDIWFPDHLEHCVAALQSDTIDIVYTKPLWVSAEALVFPIAFNLHIPSIYHCFINGLHSAIAAATVMHRASCFSELGYWDESKPKNADWDMWIRILNSSTNNFAFIREVTALHFHASWKTAEQIPDQYQIWKRFYESLSSDFPDVLWPQNAAGNPEQHIFWHQFAYDSIGFSNRLRQALSVVEDLHLSC